MKKNKKSFEMFECPCCNGAGEYMDRSKVKWNSISPPYTTCPYCNGCGEIDEDTLRDYDDSLSAYDYEQDRKEYYAECRYEEQEDIRRFGY